MKIDNLIDDLLEGDLSDSTLISELREIQERQSINIIANWSWDHPTEEGDYLACYGDVETPANVHFVRFRHDAKGILSDSEPNGLPASEYSTSYKFAKLVYATSEIKEL